MTRPTMAEYNAIHVEFVGDTVVVGFTEAILRYGQFGDKNELFDDLQRLVETEKPTRVVVRFDNVMHCSSETIGSLLKVRNTLVEKGGRLHLIRVPDHIREKLQRLNLEGTFLAVYDSLTEAISAFDQ